MRCKIYSVKDELNQEFMNPMFIADNGHTEELARRTFSTNVNEIPMWKSNPTDWSLYCIGAFDTETGILESITPDKIVNGRSVVKE